MSSSSMLALSPISNGLTEKDALWLARSPRRSLAVLQLILAGPFLSDGRSWSPLRRWLFVASFFAGSLLAFAIAVWVVGPIPPET